MNATLSFFGFLFSQPQQNQQQVFPEEFVQKNAEPEQQVHAVVSFAGQVRSFAVSYVGGGPDGERIVDALTLLLVVLTAFRLFDRLIDAVVFLFRLAALCVFSLFSGLASGFARFLAGVAFFAVFSAFFGLLFFWWSSGGLEGCSAFFGAVFSAFEPAIAFGKAFFHGNE